MKTGEKFRKVKKLFGLNARVDNPASILFEAYFKFKVRFWIRVRVEGQVRSDKS